MTNSIDTDSGRRGDAAALRASCDGAVLAPGDAGWDAARQTFLLRDQQPALGAIPAHERDVAAVVRFAAELGLRVAPQFEGHGAAALGSLADTVLLRTGALASVELDADAGTARVGAGTRWRAVVEPASELGLAPLAGSSPTVGVVGYSLGGGLGWLARRHGLACNAVTAIELVTADGELRRVDADHDAELFWALRGGGAFGVVTALECTLHPVRELTAGALLYPWERASEVLHAWREWTATVPDEVTSIGRIMQFPPIPEVPEPLRGNAFAIVEAAVLGDVTAADALLEPLRALGPALDTFAPCPPAALGTLHQDPEDPAPALSCHRLLGPLPADAVDALVAAAGPGSGSPLLSVELRHLGGALARSAPGHGALDRVRGDFCLFGVGVPFDPATAPANVAQLERVQEAFAPWDAGRLWNFADEPVDPLQVFPAATVERLRALRRRCDPQGILRANQALEAVA